MLPDFGQSVLQLGHERSVSTPRLNETSSDSSSDRIISKMRRPALIRTGIIVGTTAAVSLLHYQTATSHVWLHQLFQRGYYVPVLMAALWFGWRGGLFTAVFSGVLYAPHILVAWKGFPAYSAAQYVEIGMFFVVGGLTGFLADQEKRQRRKVEDTARKLSEVNAQLQASFEQLRRADRLSALGELSAGLAHEIRNPLGSIDGAIQILRRPELPEATRHEFGTLAEQEVSRLKGLVSNFLEFARPRIPRREPTEIGPLLDSVQGLVTESARMSGVKVRIEIPNNLSSTWIDPEQVKQVFLNLSINAIQSTPCGGEVVLRGIRMADSVAVEIQDEGSGIDPENLEKIFDPFFTTRANGTGLGLSIAYQIVSQHEGHIGVRNNHDKGVTFTVTLPVASVKSRTEASSALRQA